MCEWGFFILAISVWLFWSNNCFCVCWPFLVFFGVIFTRPRCFRVFLALHMTSTHPRHLPDTLRHHPDTARHPQTPSRHPSDTPIFGLHAATGRKSNIWLSWYLFNWFQFLRHPHTPDICLTHSDAIQTLPDTLRHHPDTPQKPPYLTYLWGTIWRWTWWPTWRCAWWLKVSGSVWKVSERVLQMAWVGRCHINWD